MHRPPNQTLEQTLSSWTMHGFYSNSMLSGTHAPITLGYVPLAMAKTFCEGVAELMDVNIEFGYTEYSDDDVAGSLDNGN